MVASIAGDGAEAYGFEELGGAVLVDGEVAFLLLKTDSGRALIVLLVRRPGYVCMRGEEQERTLAALRAEANCLRNMAGEGCGRVKKSGYLCCWEDSFGYNTLCNLSLRG